MNKKIFFLIHSLRHGGAERITLEISKYINNNKLSSKIISLTSDSQYLKNKIYKNINIIFLLKKKKFYWFYDFFQSLLKLNKIISKEDPEIIHVNSTNILILALLSNFKKNIIFIVHGYSYLTNYNNFKRIFFRILNIILIKFKNIQIVTVSKKLIPIVSNYYLIPKRKVKYVNNSINTNYFNKNRKYINNLNKIKNIAIIGTLSSNKGQYQGIKIFNKLIKISNNYRLYIIGSGEDKKKILDFITKEKLKNKVKLISSTNRIKHYYNKIHILWSLSISEGLPLSILEAMSMSIPCIGYNVRGVNEVIKNNKNGFLINFGNYHKIIKKTIELSSDTNMYKSFCKNSRLHVIKKFNYKYFLNQHHSLIRKNLDFSFEFKISILNRFFLNIFPKNSYGDFLFNYIKYIFFNKRIPFIRKTINDEILKIKTSKEIISSVRTETSSKTGTKFFLKKIGLSKYCIPTLKIIKNYSQLKENKFKQNTIIKTDHASGLVDFIFDKNNINIEKYAKWLKLNYYDISREKNYEKLKKKLLVEPIIFDLSKIIDYKFFCYNGVVKFCQLDIDRWGEHTRKFYDKNWNNLNFSLLYPQYKYNIKKPILYYKMILIAEKIAKNFNNLVRVDMYTNHKKIYIGEITHSPGSGTELFIPKDKENEISHLFFN